MSCAGSLTSWTTPARLLDTPPDVTDWVLPAPRPRDSLDVSGHRYHQLARTIGARHRECPDSLSLRCRSRLPADYAVGYEVTLVPAVELQISQIWTAGALIGFEGTSRPSMSRVTSG
jgi:hypothetical protein